MLSHECLQLTNEVGVTGEGEVGLDPLLEDGKPQLLETSDLPLRERLVRHIGEDLSTPERERGSKPLGRLVRTLLRERVPSLREESLATRRVQFLRCEHERVARRSTEQTRGAERRAQPRDVRSESCLGRSRRVAVPEVVDQ